MTHRKSRQEVEAMLADLPKSARYESDLDAFDRIEREQGTGLISVVADWLDRLDAGDPDALAGLMRLLGPDEESGAPELLSAEERDAITREIEEGQRIRAQGAAAGGNYLIGRGDL